ncbi:hypothetical protein [Pseudomonas ceruminis]|uniref:hypothetical protein n=1 Tax=Pseudomonas ceruminis TaxID=2740516 RepID=UPI001F187E81|nr:hypothetical protein [Pseudomonas ceruminis]
MSMSLNIAQDDARLMMQAGIFAKVVADLIQDNASAGHADEPQFLNEYRVDGLMMGLQLVASELCARSEWITERIDQEEEKAQAALQRRKGRDSRRESNVEGKCGTQRAA